MVVGNERAVPHRPQPTDLPVRVEFEGADAPRHGTRCCPFVGAACATSDDVPHRAARPDKRQGGAVAPEELTDLVRASDLRVRGIVGQHCSAARRKSDDAAREPVRGCGSAWTSSETSGSARSLAASLQAPRRGARLPAPSRSRPTIVVPRVRFAGMTPPIERSASRRRHRRRPESRCYPSQESRRRKPGSLGERW